ncbi:hypothetical protein KSP40_PGU015276 [Platanthera guangdongensis]|uniref:Myosin motor domain-containing protein n=1 Tax=Platanthera guangdongensis TaxID=2320717 RepID=A0ABR2M241_9ASPA
MQSEPGIDLHVFKLQHSVPRNDFCRIAAKNGILLRLVTQNEALVPIHQRSQLLKILISASLLPIESSPPLKKVKDKYKLTSPQSFHYLNQSDCYELDGVDDSLEYLATIRAMDIVGINESEQEAIFRVVAAILHLGNIDFAKGEEINSSVIKNDKSRFHLKTAAELLMCDAQGLEDALIKRVMVTPEEIITRTLDPLAMTL